MAKEKETKPKNQEYNASSIKALDQHTHLLKRISLTFGAETGSEDKPFSSQKTVSIREITDNAVDEIVGGHGNHVKVSFFKDNSVEVYDSGRGIPVDIGKDAQGNPASGIYLSLGLIQSGGKFETDSKRFSSGLNGVGASSTVHLSRRADVTVYRDGKEHKLSFKDGTPGFFDKENDPEANFTELEDYTYLEVGKDNRPAEEKKKFKTGTKIRIWLRDEVFASKYGINVDDIIERLRGTAFLVPSLYVDIYNEHTMIETQDGKLEPQREMFHFEDGLPELVKLNQIKSPLTPIIHLHAEGKYIETSVPVLQPDGKVKNMDIERSVPIEVAFGWDSGFNHTMESYVNTIRTRLGGVHETAFQRSMVAAFNEKLLSIRGLFTKGLDKPVIEDYLEGLTAVLSIKVSEPQFTGQAKEELGGREVQKAIIKALTAEFEAWVTSPKNAEVVRVIGAKVAEAAKVRQLQREERDLKRQKSAIESSNDMPVKLVDCEITHTDDSELYIAEGDSALGALKSARHSSHQAILPIRGKIINTNKANMKKVLENVEVQSIVKCLSAGVGSDFDTSKLRYGRVFIAADADSDGGAISALVLMLFWDLFRPMVLEGRLYQLLTPLFVIKITSGKDKDKRIYAQDEAEKDREVRKLEAAGTKYVINRIKGLGEANREVLNETGMNPATRTVKRITVTDIEEAQRILDVALGDDVTPRKAWIEANPYDTLDITE